MVQPAMEVAQMLEKDGISVGVINARFVKPLDVDLITRFAKSAKCVVTLEEHSVQGGFGSAVLEALHENILQPVAVKCIGVGDLVVEHGAPKLVRRDLKLDIEGILDTVQKFYQEVISESFADASNGSESHQGNGSNKNPSSNGNATEPAEIIKPEKR